MRRALAILAVLAASALAAADPMPRVITGGAREEAGAGLALGWDSVGLNAWIDRADINRTASLSYVYRWRGLSSGTEKYRSLVKTPHFGLFFRSYDTLDLITAGGTAVGMGMGFGLGLRTGTASGSFSVVAAPLAAIDGFWVVREGEHGLSARVPLGAELGVEGRVGRLVLFANVRPLVDVWPHRSAAYRLQAFAGAGWTFDLPGPREPGKPAPSGP